MRTAHALSCLFWQVQDGRSSGLTAPNGPSQSALVRTALTGARTDPAQLAVTSVHGTGTPLGDPIEVGALGQALKGGEGVTGAPAVVLLSNKSCYGHTEGAAGAASPMCCFTASLPCPPACMQTLRQPLSPSGLRV